LYHPATSEPSSTLQATLDACPKTSTALIDLCGKLYNDGFSALDIVRLLEEDTEHNINTLICFEKIKSEIRCERLLMYYLLDFMYLREDDSLKDMCFI
jgi:hypothetical protein